MHQSNNILHPNELYARGNSILLQASRTGSKSSRPSAAVKPGSLRLTVLSVTDGVYGILSEKDVFNKIMALGNQNLEGHINHKE